MLRCGPAIMRNWTRGGITDEVAAHVAEEKNAKVKTFRGNIGA